MKFLINDFNIHYEKYGKGKNTILILPGWGETRETFKFIINGLQNFFTIYIIDYPGFGKSTFPNRDLAMDDYATLIKDFITIHEIEHPILLTHSFGGRIAILLSGKYKLKFKKMILMNAAGIKPKKSIKQKIKQRIYKLLKKIGYLLPKKIKFAYLNWLIQQFGSKDYKELNENLRKSFINIINEDLTPYLNEIKTDALLLWGELDKETPLSDGKKMNKLIKDSGLVVIKNASHFPYLENPHLVYRILLNYLEILKDKK